MSVGRQPKADLKHAVQRRVAEGADRVERLANEARALLSLDAMPNRHASAEKVLAAKVDETNARFGASGGGALGTTADFEKLCRDRIKADRESGALAPSSADLLSDMLDSRESPVPCVLALLKMAKHGVPPTRLRGSDLPDEIPILEAPSSHDFFESNVLPGRPAVLRGCLDAERFPPLRNFPDLDFLRRKCGHRRVLVKSLAHDDQQGRPIFVSDPELKLPLSAFLDSVQNHEQSGSKVPFYLGKVPLRKELPELAEEVQNAPTCPQREYGACFGELIPEGVFTYFGCARNTTAVHFDAHENLLVCLCGTKRLFLYPPSDARYLYPCNDFTRSAVVPFASLEDLSQDLREKFALIRHSRPLEITLVAGDMLYLPSCWWHCVEGSDETNMILNWWFALHPDKKALARAAA